MQLTDVRRSYRQALDKHGYQTVEDVTSTSPKDLAVGKYELQSTVDIEDLGIGLSQAEEVLRIVTQQSGELHRIGRADPSARPAYLPTPAKSVTASQLLKVSPTYFSTLSVSLDKLIGYYVSGYTAPHGLNLKGRGADREDSGSIRPGAVLELSAPPGGGKTGAIIGIALSARTIDEDTPEVLLIGEV